MNAQEKGTIIRQTKFFSRANNGNWVYRKHLHIHSVKNSQEILIHYTIFIRMKKNNKSSFYHKLSDDFYSTWQSWQYCRNVSDLNSTFQSISFFYYNFFQLKCIWKCLFFENYDADAFLFIISRILIENLLLILIWL